MMRSVVNQLDDIVREFLVESHENLDQLDSDLVELEARPGSRELLGNIFRTVHTIKGTSGFLALDRLESLTHVGETLLSRLRDGVLLPTAERTTALLHLVDAIRALLATIEATGTEGSPDNSVLIGRLQQLAVVDGSDAEIEDAADPNTSETGAPEATVRTSATAASRPAEPVADTATMEPALAKPTPAKRAVPKRKDKSVAAARIAPEREIESEPTSIPKIKRLGELLIGANMVEAEDVAWAMREQEMGDERKLGEILVDQGAVAKKHLEEVLAAQNGNRSSMGEASIRVDVELLDSLVRIVGELVLTRNQILSAAIQLRDPALRRASQRLNLLASELQDGVMKTRMQPVVTVWSKLVRLVRDLSLQCGKEVALQMEGRETELDRTVLEAIKDPLTHLVRNAIDHGIETPEVRTAVGKSAGGTLLLRAFHQGGRVVVEIRDDGAGIDAQRVAAKALEQGLVSSDKVALMSDREMHELIFLPGFSTAHAVTNVSGRGVGMDVVKTNIERLGGVVEINSVLGGGTACRLTLPLTLAIVPALTVACGEHRYAIPQASLLEVVYIDSEWTSTPVEYVAGAPVYRLRGRLLPLVRLESVLEVTPASRSLLANQIGQATPRSGSSASYVVVLECEEHRFGLVVDRVLDTEEIVVKALSQRLKGIGIYAGATILDDGAVALILDIQALARRSHEIGDAIVPTTAEAAELDDANQNIESMLVVRVGEARRVAIPLEMITRLEQFPASSVERVGGREVVQYRDAIVPLVRLGSLLGGGALDLEDTVLVVVYSEQGRSVALVVEEIIDIVKEKIHSLSDLFDHGLTGSAVIGERVTELLDVRQAVLAADPNFYDDPAEVG